MRRPESLARLDPVDPLARLRLLAEACIAPEAERCVQCGLCVYNCPMGLDVRRHARTGHRIVDRGCLLCGECIRRCPRGALRYAAERDGAP